MRPRIRTALVSCVALVLAGCGIAAEDANGGPGRPGVKVLVADNDEPAHEADRPEDAPDPGRRAPEVSDDAREIAEVRALYAGERDAQFSGALERAREGTLLDLVEDLAVLEERKDRARIELRRLLAPDSSAKDEGRAVAARTLIRLGDPRGEQFLFAALKSERPALRTAAIRELIGGFDFHPDLGDPERARLVLGLVDDPDPDAARMAAFVCAEGRAPGIEAKLVAILKEGRSKEPMWIGKALAEVATSPESARLAIEATGEGKAGRDVPQFSFQVRDLLQNPDPKVAEAARDACRDYLLKADVKDRHDWFYVSERAAVARAGDEPFLEEAAAKAKSPASRRAANAALARLHPEGAVDRLLRVEDPSEIDIAELAKFATEADAGRILAALLGDGKTRGVRPISKASARLMLERLGPPGREALGRSLDRLDPDARMWAMWKLKGLDLNAALDDLHAAGVLPLPRAAMLDRMRKNRRGFRPGPIDPTDPSTLHEAFGAAGLTTAFDTETGEIPCRHDRLILRFAEGAAGRFAPECPVQEWHREGASGRGPYTVRFLLGGRLYRFGAENHGDWYDVRAVQRALNFALKASGKKERFVALDTGDQTAWLVFADPDALRPVAERYGLPLSDDPDAAVRSGKEFERKVIDGLKR